MSQGMSMRCPPDLFGILAIDSSLPARPRRTQCCFKDSGIPATLCGPGLAWKPWLGLGFVWLSLVKSHARNQARSKPNPLKPLRGPGLTWRSHGLAGLASSFTTF
jgi:hypothetical protein